MGQPLNKVQKGIYAEYLADRESTLYNIPLFEELLEGIDIGRLESAIRKAVSVHPGLSSRFHVDDNGEIVQEPNDDIDLQYIDTEEFDVGGLIEPFDLGKGSCRFRIIRTKTARYLFIDTHHIVADGTSIRILARAIGDAYDGRPLTQEKCIPDTKEETAYDWAFHDSVFGTVEAASIPLRDVYSDKPAKAFRWTEFETDAERMRRFYKDNGFSRTAFLATAFG